MTDIEVIEKISKASKPSDIFPDTEWKKTYISYSNLIHPDRNDNPLAAKAMTKMNEFKEIVENGIEYIDESGPFRVFDKRVEYKVTNENKNLLKKSYSNYLTLMKSKDAAAQNFQKYLPERMELNDDKLIVHLKDRAVPLTNKCLPQIHVNWIFSRLFEIGLWFHQINYSHLGLNPTTVFVVPETHGIIIISFYHMTFLGKKVETISAKYKAWYPTNLFSKKIATPDIDLELSKKIALYLLGDRSAAGTKLKMDKTINKNLLNFLLIKHENIYDNFTSYRDLLKKNFETKFYSLDL